MLSGPPNRVDKILPYEADETNWIMACDEPILPLFEQRGCRSESGTLTAIPDGQPVSAVVTPTDRPGRNTNRTETTG